MAGRFAVRWNTRIGVAAIVVLHRSGDYISPPMKIVLTSVLLILIGALNVFAREPEPRPQDWEFHAWMTKVAEVAHQRSIQIEGAEEEFASYWESTTDEQEITPEAAVDRYVSDRVNTAKEETERQAAFDKWWDEVKALAPAYGYQIDQYETDAQREYFFDHRFPEGETPYQAIIEAKKDDVEAETKKKRDTTFVGLETYAARVHELTPEETETFLDWAQWQRDSTDFPPEQPNAISGEQSFEAWKSSVAEEEKEECGP